MKILLVDDHQIVCDGLRLCIEGDPSHQVVGEASDGLAAIRLARELKPDAIILDIAMPGLNGIEVARHILAEKRNAPKIICLSSHSDREFIAEAFRAGVDGYLLKSSAFDELSHALKEVAGGKKYLSPSITDTILENYVRKSPEGVAGPFAALTPRERQVLQMLAEGRSAKQIATILDINHKTVHGVRVQVMAKIGVTNLSELTKYAIRHGVTTAE